MNEDPRFQTQQIPPQDIEVETAVLGACFLNRGAVEDALSKLQSSDFYKQHHQLIFKAMVGLYQQNEPVDLLTVSHWLRKEGIIEDAGGLGYLAHISGGDMAISGYSSWTTIVREKAMLRRMITMGAKIQQLCYEGNRSVEEVMADAEAELFAISGAKNQEIDSMKELVPPVIEMVTKRREIGSPVTGIPSGFHEFDRMTAGMQETNLIILAGRPSMGKTAFAMNLIRNASYESQVPCLCFSLEMSKQELTERMISCHGKVNSQGLRTGGLLDKDWDVMLKAADNLTEIPIFIDDSPSLSITEIRVRARRMVARHKVGLIVIDYLQLMRGMPDSRGNRQQEISEISRGLKGLAKELRIPVIALSQLNRGLESRSDKRPMMSDLRESGAIEQDADVIVFLYRDEVYHKDSSKQGIAEIIIAKQRNGPIGDFSVAFMKEFSRFEDLTNNHSEPWTNIK